MSAVFGCWSAPWTRPVSWVEDGFGLDEGLTEDGLCFACVRVCSCNLLCV